MECEKPCSISLSTQKPDHTGPFLSNATEYRSIVRAL